MSNDIEIWRRRVQEIMPELRIDRLERNEEGLFNDVIIVNRELVFRFAKTERGAQLLATEIKILELIRFRLATAVANPIHYRDGVVVYPFLSGEPLLRENLTDDIAHQLGGVLYALHNTEIDNLDWRLPQTPAPVTLDRWANIYQRVQEKIYPLLLPFQIVWAERLFAEALETSGYFDYQPALVHADLAPNHLLFEAEQGRMTAMLDFGVAGRGDPATDFGCLLSVYGERFVAKMKMTYPGLAQFLPRARFYAQAIELQWTLSGLESGEAFWFTAHLGAARDLRR